MEIWEPKPSGTLWATPGLLRDCFTFTFYRIIILSNNYRCHFLSTRLSFCLRPFTWLPTRLME